MLNKLVFALGRLMGTLDPWFISQSIHGGKRKASQFLFFKRGS